MFHARPIHDPLLRGMRYDVEGWVNRSTATPGYVVPVLLSGASGAVCTVSGPTAAGGTTSVSHGPDN